MGKRLTRSHKMRFFNYCYEKINLLFLCLLFGGTLQAESVTVIFYADTLELTYAPGMKLPGMVMNDPISLIKYYEAMERTPYQTLLEGLRQQQQELELNDWLYFELLHRTITQIYAQDIPLKQTLTCWFLLAQSGFDTRITYLEHTAFLYVWSAEDVFEAPMIMDRDRKFINLSSLIIQSENLEGALRLLDFRPGDAPFRSFSFQLKHLPHLQARQIEQQVRFPWRDKQFELNLELDRTIYEVMQHYPIIAEAAYLNAPLSPTLARSLLPQLRRILKGRSTLESLEILVAFTRNGFSYREDHEALGFGKPMIADELFHYPYSDCEDRSALFYQLVKDLLDLPMLIIAYPDHLTIAVAADNLQGDPIRYRTKNYFICDPTGPSQSISIGHPPPGYEKATFEILGSYQGRMPDIKNRSK